MGFLQNRAIKKSCSGLATELLRHVEIYAKKLPEGNVPKNFDQLMLDALKNFIGTFKPLPGVNLDLKSIRYLSWQNLYISILAKGVYADLAYDPNIGTEEHNKLIIEIAVQTFDSWGIRFH